MLALVVYVLTLLTGMAAAVLVEMAGQFCEWPEGDSNYGAVTWSAFPPGPGCTWTEERNGVDARHDPTPGESAAVVIWLVVVTVSGTVAFGELALDTYHQNVRRPSPRN